MATEVALTLGNLALKATNSSKENNEMYQSLRTQEKKPEDHGQ